MPATYTQLSLPLQPEASVPELTEGYPMRTLEMCAGAGGQALGLHWAGAEHQALVELDPHACASLHTNNRQLNLGWGDIIQQDLRLFAREHAADYQGRIDLLAGGVPCPPFSKAGKQLGDGDDRDLFPVALDILASIQPSALMLENVPGLLDKKFLVYRQNLLERLAHLGYHGEWRLLQASDFGVPQLRPRALLVALKPEAAAYFSWPEPLNTAPPSVGEALFDLMSARGWSGAEAWKAQAAEIAPTLVGGSHKHGGPDLGPSRAKRQWQRLGVNAHRVAADDEIPGPGFQGAVMRNGTIKPGFENLPQLTLRMVARLQGFPDQWQFSGSKTHAYRQIGNAFPPPVAAAVGQRIALALAALDKKNREEAA